MRQLLATWNPARGVWETERVALCGHSAVFSQTWPASGMTQGGTAYVLPTSAPRTDGSASSSSLPTLPTPGVAGRGKKIPEDAVWSGKAAYKPDGTKVQVHLDRIETLLPTPRTSDTNGAGVHGEGGMDLRTQVSLMGTPRSVLHKAGNMETTRQQVERNGYHSRLEEDISLLPTPQANEAKRSRFNKDGSPMLGELVTTLLPTPSEADGLGGHTSRSGARKGELLLGGVVKSIGASTPPPSDDGNESLDAPPLPLPRQDPKVDNA